MWGTFLSIHSRTFFVVVVEKEHSTLLNILLQLIEVEMCYLLYWFGPISASIATYTTGYLDLWYKFCLPPHWELVCVCVCVYYKLLLPLYMNTINNTLLSHNQQYTYYR